MIDPGEHSVISLSACTVLKLPVRGVSPPQNEARFPIALPQVPLWTRPVRTEPRRGEANLGTEGLYPHVVPILSISKKAYTGFLAVPRIKELNEKMFSDEYRAAKRVGKLPVGEISPVDNLSNEAMQFSVLSSTMLKRSQKAEKHRFLVRQIREEGRISMRRIFKKHVGKGDEPIVWGDGQWRKGQSSNVLKRDLLLDKNIAKRLVLGKETNSSVKCSNCLSLDRMYHPLHFGKRVWGIYQCSNPACGRTSDRDVVMCL